MVTDPNPDLGKAYMNAMLPPEAAPAVFMPPQKKSFFNDCISRAKLIY